MKPEIEKNQQKTDDGNPNEIGQIFRGGGTVTGRFSGASPSFDYGYVGPRRMSHENPNPQYIHRGDRPVSVLVEIDLSKLEERVMAELEAKGEGDLAEALRKALVSSKKDMHKI